MVFITDVEFLIISKITVKEQEGKDKSTCTCTHKKMMFLQGVMSQCRADTVGQRG